MIQPDNYSHWLLFSYKNVPRVDTYSMLLSQLCLSSAFGHIRFVLDRASKYLYSK